MNNSYYNVSHSRDYYKGKSIEFAGEWTSGTRYFNDEYLNSLVVYTEKDATGNIIHSALLACKKTHIAAYNSSVPDSTNNQPHLIVNNDLGIVGIEPNDYWIFISGSLVGTPGTPGKSSEVVSTYLEAVTLANENNIGKIVFVEEEKSIYIITGVGELKKIVSTSELLELAESKVDKELGKGLSTNDFSNSEKAKLKGIEENAQTNIIEEVDLNGVKIDPINKTVSINTVGSINEQTGNITLRDNSETAWDVNLHMEDHQVQGKVVTPKSVGSETTPIYFNENGEVTPINIDDEVTKNSNNLVTSKAVYRSLDLKQNQLIPGDNVIIQDNVISVTSEINLTGYAKTKDVEEKLSTKQDTLIPDNGIKIEENKISVTAITESEEQPTTSIWVNPAENTEVETTYNRSQIDALVNSKQNKLIAGDGIQIIGSTISSTINADLFITVSELPSVGENGKIYLVPAKQSESGNLADEWIWNNNSWERLGSASVDLSNCPKLVDLTDIINNETANYITETRFNELKELLSTPNTIFSFNKDGIYYYSASTDLSKISDAPSGNGDESIENIIVYFYKNQDTEGVYGYKVVLSSGFNNESHDFWWSVYLAQNDFSVNTYNGVNAGLVPSPTQGFTKKYLNVNGSWTAVKSSELDNDSGFITESGLATKQDKLIAGNNIIIEGNVISAVGGSGGESINLSEYAKKADVEAALNKKQTVIEDLDDIRLGASKGKSALQSYTETDPVYLADKPNLATKEELNNKQETIPDLLEIRSGAMLGKTSLQQKDIESLNSNITQLQTQVQNLNNTDTEIKNNISTLNTSLQASINTKQAIISDLDDIREGASLGKTSLQEHQNISNLATKDELNNKQDKILNLDIIIDGASKGATALQSFTETDPIYTNDKKNLALKSEIPDISGKQDKISDLATIREGAAKGATALQSETDPIYSADKPSLALKSELNGKQDTISDLESIREGAALGKTALQEHQDISKLATKEEVATKQDIISDLATIRSGAAKGATALQSYTESDPIYTADKPSIALKSEIPDISGKADKTTIVTETAGNSSYSIAANRLTKLGTLASNVTLSLNTASEESGVANIYDIIFSTPTNAPSIIWPEGIVWIGGNAPTIEGNGTYEISIMDNLAIYGKF